MASRDNSPSSSGSSPPPEPLSKKRGFEALAESVNASLTKKKKKEAADPYASAGRWIPRVCGPWLVVKTAFLVGIDNEIEQLQASETGTEVEPAADLGSMSEADKTMYLIAYQQILDMVPGFRKRLTDFANNPELLDDVIALMSKMMAKGRSDDSGGLRKDGIGYIVREQATKAVHPVIPKSGSKSDRGYVHPMTARLLCPRSMLDDFDFDPTTCAPGAVNPGIRAGLEDGSIQATADDFPSFLYDDSGDYDKANPDPSMLRYDPDDIEVGLCKGYYLVRILQHIYSGPSVAAKSSTNDTNPPEATKGAGASNAKLHGMEEVTPGAIAYAAVQGWFMISSMESWRDSYGDFNLRDFYNNIVRLFEDRTSPWVIETLQWWNKKIYGNPTPATKTAPNSATPSSSSSRDSALKRLVAQRARKAQEKAARDALAAGLAAAGGGSAA